MKISKTNNLIVKNIVEFYLLLSVLYYWFSTTLLNPIALVLFLITLGLIISKNRVLGIVIGCIFLLINAYMFLALASELNEFTEFNRNAKMLLFGGITYLGLNVFAALALIIKWSSPHHFEQEIDIVPTS